MAGKWREKAKRKEEKGRRGVSKKEVLLEYSPISKYKHFSTLSITIFSRYLSITLSHII